MELHPQTLDRICSQYKIIRHYIDDLPPQAIHTRLSPDKWSVQETVAYLCRYHYVFMARLKSIRTEINPFFEVYLRDRDSQYQFTVARSTGALLHEIDRLRSEIKRELEEMPSGELSRIGTHAVLGRMNICQWLEFFLLHESMQLYKIFRLAGNFWASSATLEDNVISLPGVYSRDERVG